MEKLYFTVLLRDRSNNFVKKGLIQDVVINNSNKLKNISSIQISKLSKDNNLICEIPYILIYNKKNNQFVRKSMYNVEKNMIYIFECEDENDMYNLFIKLSEIIKSENYETEFLPNLKVKK